MKLSYRIIRYIILYRYFLTLLAARILSTWLHSGLMVFWKVSLCLILMHLIFQFILLGAVPFPIDVPHLKELGVRGVITLNEPYETLVPTTLYHVSVLCVVYSAD